jgi:hypothetical protein
VAAPLPFSESELGLLSSLLKHNVRFMVVGLSAATLQGAPVVTQDVIRWFEKLGDDGDTESSGNNPPLFSGSRQFTVHINLGATPADSL